MAISQVKKDLVTARARWNAVAGRSSLFCIHVKQQEPMMKTEKVSARLSPETAKKFTLLSKAISRSKSYLAAEAIEAYVNDQQWQIEAIIGGIKEADEGRFATDQQVQKSFRKCGKKMPFKFAD
jgi:predicted transcriptional regulator